MPYVFSLAVVLGGARASAQPAAAKASPADIARWVVQVRGTEAEQALAAVEALQAAGPDAQRRARAAVTELLPRRRRVRDAARRRVLRSVEFLGQPKRLETILKALDKHAEIAAEAIRFAFSNADYPVPAKARTGWSPGHDYQKGQVLLEGRIEVAIARYNQAESMLVRAFGFSLSPKAPGGGGFGKAYLAGKLRDTGQPLRVLKYNLVDSGPAWAAIGARFAREIQAYDEAERLARLAETLAGKAGVDVTAAAKAPEGGAAAPKDGAPAPDEAQLLRFARAAGALFAGQYDKALELKPADDSAARLFDLLVRRHVMVRSAKRSGPWSRGDKEAMHLLNVYRLSLGLWPMIAQPKIYAACREHSQWQDRNHTMSHTRPESKMRSFGDRCREAGYHGALGENIAGGSAAGAVWMWRADAGHHRNLLNPRGRACAIAGYGRYVTYNPGRTVEIEGLAELMGAASGPRRPPRRRDPPDLPDPKKPAPTTQPKKKEPPLDFDPSELEIT